MFQPGYLDVEHSTDVVLSGTLDGLVDCLIMRPRTNDVRRYNFHEVFWTTCSEFIEHPFHLFQKLSERFEREGDIAIRSNIVCIMDEWLQYQHFLPNQEDLQQMRTFCNEAISRAESQNVLKTNLLQLRRQLYLHQGPGSMSVSHTSQSSSVPLPPNASPHDLAVALTLLEADNFTRIRPYMYLQRRSSVIINRVCNTNNRIEKWVSWSIINNPLLDSRKERMTHFIKTALACRRLRNFSTAMAIALALHSPTARKLEETRKALTRDKWKKLKELSKFVDGNSHYKEVISDAYRRGSCIPWLEFHLRELDGISDNHAMYLENGYINFRRHNAFTYYLKGIKPYEIPPDLEYLRDQPQIAFIQDQLDRIDLDGIDHDLERRSEELKNSEIEIRRNRLRRLGLDV